MFTIKQLLKDPESPKQNICRMWEGTNIEISYNDRTELAELHFTMIDGARCSIDTGLVYVMNSSGKTVDTARLKGSEWF